MTIIEMNGAAPKSRRSAWREWQTTAIENSELPASVEKTDPRATEVCVPKVRNNLAAAKITHLSAIIQGLNQLRLEPEKDENGDCLRPTEHAYEICCRLLVGAAIQDYAHRAADPLQQAVIAIPLGLVASDEKGGVRVEWVREGARVCLVVPFENTSMPYVYCETGVESKVTDATECVLASALRSIR